MILRFFADSAFLYISHTEVGRYFSFFQSGLERRKFGAVRHTLRRSCRRLQIDSKLDPRISVPNRAVSELLGTIRLPDR